MNEPTRGGARIVVTPCGFCSSGKVKEQKVSGGYRKMNGREKTRGQTSFVFEELGHLDILGDGLELDKHLELAVC